MREVKPSHRLAANQSVTDDEQSTDRLTRRSFRFLAPRLCGAAVIAFALAILPYRAFDSDSEAMLIDMTADVASASDRLIELDSENAVLKKEIRALADDPRAIEEFARRDLGMVRPGEILMKIEAPK